MSGAGANEVPSTILVAIDGSSDSARALEWAIALAAAVHGEVVAVHALGLLTHFANEPLRPSEHQREQVRQVFESTWCGPLRESGLAYRCLLVDGSPVPALMSAASQVGANLIVVGSRGSGALSGLLLGSTSRQLVEHADRAVVVVPPPDKASLNA